MLQKFKYDSEDRLKKSEPKLDPNAILLAPLGGFRLQILRRWIYFAWSNQNFRMNDFNNNNKCIGVKSIDNIRKWVWPLVELKSIELITYQLITFAFISVENNRFDQSISPSHEIYKYSGTTNSINIWRHYIYRWYE